MSDSCNGSHSLFGIKLNRIREVRFVDGSADEENVRVCAVRESQSKLPGKAGVSAKEQNDIMSGLSALLGIMKNFRQGLMHVLAVFVSSPGVSGSVGIGHGYFLLSGVHEVHCISE